MVRTTVQNRYNFFLLYRNHTLSHYTCIRADDGTRAYLCPNTLWRSSATWAATSMPTSSASVAMPTGKPKLLLYLSSFWGPRPSCDGVSVGGCEGGMWVRMRTVKNPFYLSLLSLLTNVSLTLPPPSFFLLPSPLTCSSRMHSASMGARIRVV